MNFTFTVHRANDSTVSRTAVVEGKDAAVSVACFEVELVDDQNRAYTHQFIGAADIAEAKKYFAPNKKVVFALYSEYFK